MKHLMLVSLIALSPYFTQAQSWEKTFLHGIAQSSLQSQDGGIAVCTYGVPYNPEPFEVQGSYLLKTDIEGEEEYLEALNYGDVEFESMDIAETSEGDLLFTGMSNSGYHPVILKTSPNGELIFIKQFDEYSAWIYSITATNDGGCVIVGNNLQIVTEEALYEVFALKVDANGNEVWMNTYSDSGSGTKIIETADGGFVIASNNYLYGNPTNEDEFSSIIKIDSYGEQQWINNEMPTQQTAQSVAETPQGDFLTVGWVFDTISNQYSAVVHKFNSIGNMIGNMVYSHGTSTIANDICAITNGGFAICGRFNENTTQYAFITKCDINGEEEWTQTYNYGSTFWDPSFPGAFEFHSIDQTTDGGFLLSGIHDSEVFVVKTGPDGLTLSATELQPSTTPRTLIRTVNTAGAEVPPNTPGLLIHIYSDGTTSKQISIKN